MNTWVVIPALNEGSVIRTVVNGVRERCSNVVVVDDGSTDRTGEEARAAGAVVLRHLIVRGQGAALKTGIDYGLSQGAEIIVTFDGDGQHDPADIPAMLAPIEEGKVRVTLASRFLRNSSNIPPLRRVVLKLGVLFTRIFSHIAVTDTHNGLRAFHNSAAERIRIVQDQMAHASEILDEIVRWGIPYQEVPARVVYSYYSKEKGQSSLEMFKIAVKFILHKLRN